MRVATATRQIDLWIPFRAFGRNENIDTGVSKKASQILGGEDANKSSRLKNETNYEGQFSVLFNFFSKAAVQLHAAR